MDTCKNKKEYGFFFAPHVPLSKGSKQHSLIWWKLGVPRENDPILTSHVQHILCLSISMSVCIYRLHTMSYHQFISFDTERRVNLLSYNLVLKIPSTEKDTTKVSGTKVGTWNSMRSCQGGITITYVVSEYKQNALCGKAVGRAYWGRVTAGYKIPTAYFRAARYESIHD